MINQHSQTTTNSQFLVFIFPNILCKLLNNATIFINLWWSRTHEILLVGMGVATIFSFVFGYMIIISMNTGLAYQISRNKQKPQKIGIYYQRALLMNFLICAIVITPLLYISNKVVLLFDHIDNDMAIIIGDYLFQLLPSIYCFAFFDTTETYLHNQGHIIAPLIIQIVSVFTHLYLINYIGAAWAKNFTDIFCCIAIYAYIQLLDRPIKSWIQWTIKCIKGWGNHIKFLELIGLSTYIDALFFFFFSLTAYKINQNQLICHICFINIIQIIFLLFLGIKVGILVMIGPEIKHDSHRSNKAQAQLTIKIILVTGFLFISFIFIYKAEIADFFIIKIGPKLVFLQNYWILFLTVGLKSVQVGLSSLLKAVQKDYAIFKFNIFYYSLSIFLSVTLCYNYEYGLKGIWYGWIIGIGANSITCAYYLRKKQLQTLQHQTIQRRKLRKQKQLQLRQIKKKKQNIQKNEQSKQLKQEKQGRANKHSNHCPIQVQNQQLEIINQQQKPSQNQNYKEK